MMKTNCRSCSSRLCICFDDLNYQANVYKYHEHQVNLGMWHVEFVCETSARVIMPHSPLH
jgi:hypothetical protein